MTEMPLPMIVCSEVAHHRTEDAISALELGAVEVIRKPKLGVRGFLEESRVMFLDAVMSAAHVRRLPCPPPTPVARNTADAVLPLEPAHRGRPGRAFASDRIVAVGASTGGTEAIREFLQAMPAGCPGIVIVQHMPEMFTRAFANRLDRDCHIEVKEAADGDPIVPGRALIAPGNHHLMVQHKGSGFVAQVKDGPLVSRHRPSVDVLFRSVANCVGGSAIGVIMTGMGDDGAQGLLELRRSGAQTIAQDESSCVVFGMPREAIRLGAVAEVLPLPRIARSVLQMCAAPLNRAD